MTLLDSIAAWFVAKIKALDAWIPVPSGPVQSDPPNLPTDTPYPTLTQVILAYNNGHSFFALSPTWSIPAKGVAIHKIDQTQAEAIAVQATESAKQYGLPLTYVLACLAVESVLDPLCQNGNLGPGESNTANDPLGYDMGIAQLKLRYLVGSAKGATNATTAQAFALDVTRAIPYFCSIMAGKVAYAKQVIASDTSSSPLPQMRNPLVLGTWFYNEGDTGGMTAYNAGQFPTHCQSVVNDEQYFASKLGVPSVFTGLPK